MYIYAANSKTGQVTKSNTYKYLCKNLFLFIVLFLAFPFLLWGKNDYNKADSIIIKVLENRGFYGKYIEEYNATAYIKGNSYVKKKNILYRYAPSFLYLDKKNKSAFVESIVNINFKAPNYFTQKILAVNGSKISMNDIRERVMQFLNVNIYNPSIFNNQILIPEVKEIFKYYRFEYISTTDTLNHKIHQIEIIPKVNSQQLISGFLYVVDNLWTIYQFDITGKWEFSTFRIATSFGLPDKDFLLPLETEITFHLNIVGNEVINYYYSSFRYEDVNKNNSSVLKKNFNYDLSDYFNVSLDSLPVVKDEKFWRENRPVPLTADEKSLIEALQENRQAPDTLNKMQGSWTFSQGFISPKQFKYNDSQMSYSGLLNPFTLAYSKLDGIVYWQKFRYRKINRTGRELQFSPDIGFLFRRKQVYFNLPVQWLLQPEKMGEIHFTIQNRNQSYNSTFIDMIEKEIPDSIKFSDFNLKYYHRYLSGLEGQYEIANGLLIRGGINYGLYTPVKHKNKKKSDFNDNIGGDVTDLVTDRYRVFLPAVDLTWTPHQFYRIKGKRKEYLNSRFPTLSVEYSLGIRGVLGSNSNYEQIEADIQQKIPLGLTNSFQYYIGTGKFLKTNSLYFADFNLFQKSNLPKSWDDPIGGIFQLLRGEWYNASRSYIQAHFMYEYPYTLLRLFRNVTKDILSERIYVSQLYTPILPCYTEIGYGVGNFIGNAGVFVSLVKGKYESAGIKFTLELGK